LPARPLRLSPKTATAGGRAHVTPGTGPTSWPPSRPPATARAGPAPTASSSTPAAARRLAQRTARHRLLPRTPPVDDRHQLGYQRHRPGPVVLQRIDVSEALGKVLAAQLGQQWVEPTGDQVMFRGPVEVLPGPGLQRRVVVERGTCRRG